MKLKFEKNENEEIFVKINGEDFFTKDYIEMIKEVKKEKKIEAEFGENITEEEQKSVESMLKDINDIKELGYKEDKNEGLESEDGEEGDEIKIEDIPF